MTERTGHHSEGVASLGITDHGRRQVERDLEVVMADVNRLREQLRRAQANEERLRRCVACPHPPKAVKAAGGFEYTMTTCTACGYTWFD